MKMVKGRPLLASICAELPSLLPDEQLNNLLPSLIRNQMKTANIICLDQIATAKINLYIYKYIKND